ncbi:hypothetical protein Q7P35_001216 [Cladosporium inversicolor]
MSTEKAIHTDHPVPPSVHQTAVSTNGHGMKLALEAPSIGLATYLIGVSLGFDKQFGSGVLITTSFISAARLVDSGFSKKESIVRSASLGLFAQLVCCHFEMNFTMRIGNALSTLFSIYLALRNSSSNIDSSAENLHLTSEDDLDSPADESVDHSESKSTSIWLVFAGLLLVATLASYLFTNQPPTNNCIVTSRKIDSVHWQAVVREGDHPGKSCGVATQMSLAADEMRAFTRGLKEEACSVNCIKQNSAGYWTAYVSITPPGGPADGTYCSEAYSNGDCGQGVTRK